MNQSVPPSPRLRPRVIRCRLVGLCLVIGLSGSVWGVGSITTVGGRAPRPDEVSAADLRAAMERSAHYLVSVCDEQGQFKYRVHLEPDITPEPQYNELRHAGTIYAMAKYCQRTGDPEVLAAMLRAATFLRQRCIAPVEGNPNLLAVWSEPELVGEDQPRQAKLGGAGLGLVALLSVERLEPGFTPRDELRALGRFVLFLQKPNGEFYSKYFPGIGRSDIWQSMYFPGEAALGLLMLYQYDPSPQWLRGAQNALVAIARQAHPEPKTFPDHWFLLATEQWFRLRDEQVPEQTTDEILYHVRRVCSDMVADQQGQLEAGLISGCFTPDGRTCPTATRLEGLLATLGYLPAIDHELTESIRPAVQHGLQFLLRAQVAEGPLAGAIPRAISGFEQPPDASDGDRAGEVRVDYVQHGLSAMIQFERVFGLQADSH